jgi:hypothetical protein
LYLHRYSTDAKYFSTRLTVSATRAVSPQGAASIVPAAITVQGRATLLYREAQLAEHPLK